MELKTVLSFSLLVTMVIAQNNSLADITFRINEELDAGIYIGNVAAESNLVNKKLSFKIITGDETLVVLNLSTGELKTKKIIDRETVCKNQRDCLFLYTILAYDGNAQYQINVNLVIVDINDNTPYFESPSMTLNMSEALPVGSVKPLMPANDLDKGDNNSVVGYFFSSFSTINDTFGLQVEKNADNSLSVFLKLVKMLDRETKDSYIFVILAKDGGTPVLTGSLTVTVNVLDENDNKPIFNDIVTNINVTEDTPVGIVIVTLTATDKDAGKNGEVQYHLAQSQEQYILDHFDISLTSGELFVAQTLVYPVNSNKVTIVIVANDLGTPPRSSKALVNLTIIDIGNKPPQVKLTYLTEEISPSVTEVSENISLNEIIVHVSVEDRDTGVYGIVTCQMHNTFFGLKTIPNSQNAYIIFIQHALDRETMSFHNITVTCTDGGFLETSVHFVVSVKDENDNAPLFSKYIYMAQLNENNVPGVSILTVSATDADIGENGRVTYSINSNYATDFIVEENTGIIRARTSFDREKESQKVVEILGMDHGNPALTSTVSLILTILDVNDNRPVFTQSTYEFRVMENMEANTLVDKVTVTDADQGENKRTECYMLSQNGTQFTVMPDGQIKTNMPLDREDKSEYLFDVGVRDFGVPQRNNSVRVIVRVDDANDNAPTFVYPSADNYTVEALNEVSQTETATVLATDADAGVNQALLYFIAEGNVEQIFRLDQYSGKLFIQKYINSEKDIISELKLAVYDQGQPPLFSYGKLIVIRKYTNATYLPGTEVDSKKTYIVIVATVVCLTCVLSITIITVICLIRRKDRYRSHDESNKLSRFSKSIFNRDTTHTDAFSSESKQENICHHREDSNSEKSTETTTSHDSGKGGSVEGESLEHDYNNTSGTSCAVKMEPGHSSAYKQQRLPSEPPLNRSSTAFPPKPSSLKATTNKPFCEFNNILKYPQASGSDIYNQSWCNTFDLTVSYPDSGYMSLGSGPNCSQGQITAYRDPKSAYISQNRETSKVPHSGNVYNLPCRNTCDTYRGNSTRDDDETTTTSGSYVINNEDIDDDMPSKACQVSQVV